jgi:diguanylate cyclase (GGDEF)-like protein/PAS domain S-box-containing protein
MSASESLRLEALRSLNQLPHTVPFPVLDAIVETAAAVCDVPIALVTLVEEHEQFFKAQMGLDRAGTPREISFCTHAIEGPGIYEVTDARSDELFASNPLVTGDDQIRFYAGAPMTTSSGHRIGTVCVLDQTPRQLTERQRIVLAKLAEACVQILECSQKNMQQEAWFARTLETVVDAVLSVNPHGVVNYANPAALELLGAAATSVLAQPVESVLGLIGPAALHHPVRECLASGGSMRSEGVVVDRHGDVSEIEYSVTSVTSDAGNARGAVVVFRDVGRNRQLEAQARCDPLTGTYNRLAFESRLAERLSAVAPRPSVGRDRRRTGSPVVMFIDLDHFKQVNDSLGHPIGDALLRDVALRMQQRLGESDMLARFGGDEFAILLNETTPSGAISFATELLADLAALCGEYHDARGNVSASVGLAVADEPGLSVAEVLRRADSGCYAAKNAGRDRVRLFDPTSEDEAWSESLCWMDKVERALRGNDFELFGQQIMSLRDTRPSIEVLVRMQRDGKLVLPCEFIPGVERFVLASQVDEWVLAKTLETLSQSPELYETYERFHVNLSAKTLVDPAMALSLAAMIDASDVPAPKLCFEITETAAIADLGAAREFMNVLRHRGCTFALDDFGRGFASFEHLKRLPIDLVKIDGLFVTDLASDPVSRHMVAAVQGVCSHLGITTIAECVESEAAIEELIGLGVDEVQGYLRHRPEPLRRLLARPQRRKAHASLVTT